MVDPQATGDAAWTGGAAAGRADGGVGGSAREPAPARLVGVGDDPLLYPPAELDAAATPDDGESDLVSHVPGRGAAGLAGAAELGRHGRVQLASGLCPG